RTRTNDALLRIRSRAKQPVDRFGNRKNENAVQRCRLEFRIRPCHTDRGRAPPLEHRDANPTLGIGREVGSRGRRLAGEFFPCRRTWGRRAAILSRLEPHSSRRHVSCAKSLWNPSLSEVTQAN